MDSLQAPRTPDEYRAMRQQCGTQATVAAWLEVDRGTVARRETAALPITAEAALALLALQNNFHMKTMYYAGGAGVPFQGVYGLFIDHSPPIQRVVIVIGGLGLFNSDSGRDAVLNRILDTELRGVRLDFVRFIVVVGHDTDYPVGKEFEIGGDLGPIRKKYKIWRTSAVASDLIVGGATTFSTDFERGQILPEAETKQMLRLAGLVPGEGREARTA
jgi:hypothetical protein